MRSYICISRCRKARGIYLDFYIGKTRRIANISLLLLAVTLVLLTLTLTVSGNPWRNTTKGGKHTFARQGNDQTGSDYEDDNGHANDGDDAHTNRAATMHLCIVATCN